LVCDKREAGKICIAKFFVRWRGNVSKMDIEEVALFISIINCFSVRDKWEMARLSGIPGAVNKFPIQRVAWRKWNYVSAGWDLCCRVFLHEFFFASNFSVFCNESLAEFVYNRNIVGCYDN